VLPVTIPYISWVRGHGVARIAGVVAAGVHCSGIMDEIRRPSLTPAV